MVVSINHGTDIQVQLVEMVSAFRQSTADS